MGNEIIKYCEFLESKFVKNHNKAYVYLAIHDDSTHILSCEYFQMDVKISKNEYDDILSFVKEENRTSAKIGGELRLKLGYDTIYYLTFDKLKLYVKHIKRRRKLFKIK